MATTATPPVSPDVAGQQAPASQQFVEGAMQRGAGAVQQGPRAAMQFAMQKLQVIAKEMGELAQVLAVEKPVVMPLITRAAGMLKMVEQQVQQSAQGPNASMSPGSEPSQAAMSAPEGQDALGF